MFNILIKVITKIKFYELESHELFIISDINI